MTEAATIAPEDTRPCNKGGPRIRPLAERFWEKVDKTGDCWNWTATLDGSGYGMIGSGGAKGKNRKAHRVSWEFRNGPIPANLCVMHRCDNPRCVNPDHLMLGTVAENNADRDRKGRAARTDGEFSPSAKLTTTMALSILRRVRAGENAAQLAAEFGVSKGTIYAIKSGQNWPNIRSAADE